MLGSSKVKSHSKRLRNSFIGFVIRLRRYVADGIQNQNKPIWGRIFLTKDLPNHLLANRMVFFFTTKPTEGVVKPMLTAG
jgi:hypothetical protein